MLLHTKSKKVLLNLKHPERVETVIPTARRFTYKGRSMLAVPHKDNEVKVLRNLGIDVPSPVLYYYGWPSIFPSVYQHQKETVKFLTDNNRAFVLNGMGTGKSISTLWALDYLKTVGVVKRTLIVSPLSTLERVWGDEIWKHFPHLTFSVVHGDWKKRLKLLEQDVDVYIINHDGIKIKPLVEALSKRPDIDLVVIDECAAFRNVNHRWRAMNTICNKQHPRRVWGLTGTPTPNEPTDAWAQCKLIVPERATMSGRAFKDLAMRQVSQYRWVPRDDAIETVAQIMQPSIRFKREDCIDLPPVVFEMRHAEMTDVQKKAYKLMAKKLAFEAASQQVIAVNEAVKASKLVQIACGAAYDDSGKTVALDCSTRIELVKEIIEEAEAKVLVFVPFTAALEHVAAELRKHWSVEIVYGDVSKTARDAIFSAFKQSKDPHVIVADARCMSHGLSLTEANTIIWFAPPTSNETFEQACCRVSRPGQKIHQLIAMIEGSEIERRMYDRLKNKQKLQGTLLKMIEEGVE